MRTRLIHRSLLASVSGALAIGLFTGPAAALADDDGFGSDTGSSGSPDLRVSAATVSPASTTEWTVSYTVRNDGTGEAKPSAVAFRHNDSGSVLAQRSVPALAVGASRSETFRIARSGCYLPLRATADASGTAGDMLTGNNSRWVIGQVLPCSSLPRYRVKAVSFTAGDESNFDGAGSDEPYWIFSTVSNGSARYDSSNVFSDVDSGESRSFASTDGCVYGGCTGGVQAPHGLGFSVQLWEKDLGHVDQTLYDTAAAFQQAGAILSMTGQAAWVGKTVQVMGQAMETMLGWADDDLIGNKTYAMAPEYLASRLNRVGGSFTDTKRYEGAETSGGANYTMTVQVSRVA